VEVWEYGSVALNASEPARIQQKNTYFRVPE